MVALAQAHPSYTLLQGRGQPGTQDVTVGTRILHAFREGNMDVAMPMYDKSAFEGAGDRCSEWRHITEPVDFVLFEGWCLGFRSYSPQELTKIYNDVQYSSPPPAFAQCSLDELAYINTQLATWEKTWYPLMDAFIQFAPVAPDEQTSPWSLIYPWRLEAEQAMKRSNGGHGMSDEQVYAFVRRYIPSYELFGHNRCTLPHPWAGHCMVLSVHRDRHAERVEYV